MTKYLVVNEKTYGNDGGVQLMKERGMSIGAWVAYVDAPNAATAALQAGFTGQSLVIPLVDGQLITVETQEIVVNQEPYHSVTPL